MPFPKTAYQQTVWHQWTKLIFFPQCFFFNRRHGSVCTCLYTWSKVFTVRHCLCFAWCHLVHLLQGNAMIREWLGKDCSLIWLCAFACRRDWPVGVPYFSAWLSLSGPFQHSDHFCSFSDIYSLIFHVLKCEFLLFFLFFSQQAWPTGTQQILIPSSWQQVPGVAIHSSAHQSNVAESPLETLDAPTQQGHSWRWANQRLLEPNK